MFKYNEGDSVGPYKNILLKRLYKGKRSYYCEFKCSQCEHTFVSLLSSVSSGSAHLCKECVFRQQQERGRKVGKLSHFKDYTKIENPFFLFVKPTLEQDSDGNRYWIIQCKKCGKQYKVIPSQLISQKRRRGNSPCSCWTVCRNSKGALLIESILQDKNIKYIKEYHFLDCLSDTGSYLYFDFYLPDYNCCIEYDGEQHFSPNKKFAYSEQEAIDKFYKQQRYDKIKNQYCDDNHIKLIRIPYYDYKNISFDYLIEKGLSYE